MKTFVPVKKQYTVTLIAVPQKHKMLFLMLCEVLKAFGIKPEVKTL